MNYYPLIIQSVSYFSHPDPNERRHVQQSQMVTNAVEEQNFIARYTQGKIERREPTNEEVLNYFQPLDESFPVFIEVVEELKKYKGFSQVEGIKPEYFEDNDHLLTHVVDTLIGYGLALPQTDYKWSVSLTRKGRTCTYKALAQAYFELSEALQAPQETTMNHYGDTITTGNNSPVANRGSKQTINEKDPLWKVWRDAFIEHAVQFIVVAVFTALVGVLFGKGCGSTDTTLPVQSRDSIGKYPSS